MSQWFFTLGTHFMNAKSLSSETPITIALAIAICGGAFWVGRTTQSIQSQLNMEVKIREIEKNNIKEWKEELSGVLSQLTKIAQQNEKRIQSLEEQDKNF